MGLLHLDHKELVDGYELIDETCIAYNDTYNERLQRLKQEFPVDVKCFDEDPRSCVKAFPYLCIGFYGAMRRIIQYKVEPEENASDASFEEVANDTLRASIQDETQLRDALIETNTEPPRKRARLAKADNEQIAVPTSAVSQDASIPILDRPNSAESAKSTTSSILQATKECETVLALSKFLDPFCWHSTLEVVGRDTEYTIRLGGKRAKTRNDGQIVNRCHKSSVMINIETKAWRGYHGPNKFAKLLAQIFAESLGIVQKRLQPRGKRRRAVEPTRSTLTVYTLCMCHRRAFLAKITFSNQYLAALDRGDLGEHRVLLERTKLYRLDKKQYLQAFVTLLLQLVVHCEAEVEASRQC